MGDEEFLAERFEANRSHLRAVAYRMLGSATEADDAVQEAWIRLSRSDTTDVENLGGLAHDRHRAGVPRHAALAHVPARRPARRGAPGTRREPAVGDRPGGRSGPRRLGRSRAARRARDTARRPNGSRSCSTTCSPCRSTRSRRSSDARRPRRASSRAAPGAGCRERPPSRRPTSPASARWWRRSSRRLATGTSTGCSHCSTPTSCCTSTRSRCRPARRPRSAARKPWPARRAPSASRARFARPALINGAVGTVVAPRGRLQLVQTFTIVDGKVVELEVIVDPERLGSWSSRCSTTDSARSHSGASELCAVLPAQIGRQGPKVQGQGAGMRNVARERRGAARVEGPSGPLAPDRHGLRGRGCGLGPADARWE